MRRCVFCGLCTWTPAVALCALDLAAWLGGELPGEPADESLEVLDAREVG
jgi:hypothetical protein